MGKRGPAPKPHELRLADGTYRPDKHGAEPPSSGPLEKLPLIPRHLGTHGKSAWRRNGPVLIGMGLIEAEDLDAFTKYCELFDEIARCDRVLKRDGDYQVMDSGGIIREHPAVKRKGSAIDRIMRLQQQFGMTPAARTSMPQTQSQKQASQKQASQNVARRKRG